MSPQRAEGSWFDYNDIDDILRTLGRDVEDRNLFVVERQ